MGAVLRGGSTVLVGTHNIMPSSSTGRLHISWQSPDWLVYLQGPSSQEAACRYFETNLGGGRLPAYEMITRFCSGRSLLFKSSAIVEWTKILKKSRSRGSQLEQEIRAGRYFSGRPWTDEMRMNASFKSWLIAVKMSFGRRKVVTVSPEWHNVWFGEKIKMPGY